MKHEHELVGIDLRGARGTRSSRLWTTCASELGEEEWAKGMNPDVPETKILDNPYKYTDYSSGATHGH